MSNFLAEPCRRRLLGHEKENEIRAIFYRHWENMKKQMKLTIDTIDDWRSQSIQEINTYAEEQVRILKADYDDQRLVFDQMRDANLDTAIAYHTSKQSDLFHELRETCESLKFQVAQLESVKHEIERPKVIIVEEQRRRKKQEYTNTYIPKYEEREERWKVKDTTEIEQNRVEKTDLSSKTTSSASNGTYVQSSMTTVSNNDGISNRSNDNQEARAANSDDSSNRCPVCFMIFPLSMSNRDRHQHVGEHYTDDHDRTVGKF